MIPTRQQRTRRRPLSLVCGLLLGTLLLGTTALAEPTAAEKETARSLLGAGQKKFDSGDYAGALEAWRAADDIMHVPTTGVRLGKAQEKLGKLVEARDTWLEVARHPVEPNEPKAFTTARKEATTLAGAVEKRIPSVTVTVSGVTPDVELDVAVDGVSVPPAAATLPRKINPGAHHLRVSAPGFLIQEQDFSLEEAENRTLNLELARDPAAATAPPEPPPEAPTPPPQPTPGPLAAPPPGNPRADSGGGSNTLSIVGFTLAGVGVVVGGVTGIMSATKTSDIKDGCEGTRCPGDSQSDIDSAKTLATVSNIGFGVGILGLGIGVLGLVLDSGSAQRQAPAVASAKRGFTLTPVVGVGSFNVLGKF